MDRGHRGPLTMVSYHCLWSYNHLKMEVQLKKTDRSRRLLSVYPHSSQSFLQSLRDTLMQNISFRVSWNFSARGSVCISWTWERHVFSLPSGHHHCFTPEITLYVQVHQQPCVLFIVLILNSLRGGSWLLTSPGLFGNPVRFLQPDLVLALRGSCFRPFPFYSVL